MGVADEQSPTHHIRLIDVKVTDGEDKKLLSMDDVVSARYSRVGRDVIDRIVLPALSLITIYGYLTTPRHKYLTTLRLKVPTMTL